MMQRWSGEEGSMSKVWTVDVKFSQMLSISIS